MSKNLAKAATKNSLLTSRNIEQILAHGERPSASTGWVEIEKERERERARDTGWHSIIMGLIAIYTIIILTGLMILLIELNEMVTVVIIIIKAVGVDQAHGAVDGSTVLDPDSEASEKNLQKVTGGTGETRKHKTM